MTSLGSPVIRIGVVGDKRVRSDSPITRLRLHITGFASSENRSDLSTVYNKFVLCTEIILNFVNGRRLTYNRYYYTSIMLVFNRCVVVIIKVHIRCLINIYYNITTILLSCASQYTILCRGKKQISFIIILGYEMK